MGLLCTPINEGSIFLFYLLLNAVDTVSGQIGFPGDYTLIDLSMLFYSVSRKGPPVSKDVSCPKLHSTCHAGPTLKSICALGGRNTSLCWEVATCLVEFLPNLESDRRVNGLGRELKGLRKDI